MGRGLQQVDAQSILYGNIGSRRSSMVIPEASETQLSTEEFFLLYRFATLARDSDEGLRKQWSRAEIHDFFLDFLDTGEVSTCLNEQEELLVLLRLQRLGLIQNIESHSLAHAEWVLSARGYERINQLGGA